MFVLVFLSRDFELDTNDSCEVLVDHQSPYGANLFQFCFTCERCSSPGDRIVRLQCTRRIWTATSSRREVSATPIGSMLLRGCRISLPISSTASRTTRSRAVLKGSAPSITCSWQQQGRIKRLGRVLRRDVPQWVSGTGHDLTAEHASIKVYVYVHLYSAFLRKAPQMRSDMDHTVLPANYTIPSFTPQPQNITAFWLVFILRSHGG